MKGLTLAVAFLTRVPIPVEIKSSEELGAAVPWFPVIGAGIGAVVGAVAWTALGIGIPPLVAAAVAVAASLLLTGAFHEDGLADTFDGLGSGHRGDDAIEIMRDPRIGAFGAAALIMGLLLQVGTLGSVPRSDIIGVAVAAHTASRAFAVLVMFMPAVAHSGLAAEYTRAVGPFGKIFGAAVGFGIAGAILRSDSWIMLPAVVTGAVIMLWSHSRIGGITGDVLGAIQQVTMVTILVGATSLGF